MKLILLLMLLSFNADAGYLVKLNYTIVPEREDDTPLLVKDIKTVVFYECDCEDKTTDSCINVIWETVNPMIIKNIYNKTNKQYQFADKPKVCARGKVVDTDNRESVWSELFVMYDIFNPKPMECKP